jgi:ATP phosphoribosyltransferase
MAAADEQSLYRLYKAEEEIMQYLTIALTKGRLAGQTMELFEKAGYYCEELKDKKSRKLIFTNEEQKLRFFLSKGPDVPTYVEYGAADIGIVGSDIILEEQRRCHEVLDLGFGRCRMCVAGPPEAKELLQHHEMIRVASKYPNIARDYFYNRKHQTVDIIKLNGSIELAPILSLSDVIVDIVETGTTLRENDLDVVETVVPISARLIANKAAFRFKTEEIERIAKEIKEQVKTDD